MQKKRISLKDYDFKKENLTIETFFGLKEEENKFLYAYLFRSNGALTFVHERRDVGCFSLPKNYNTPLDQDVGALSIKFLPDQPHEYTGKNVSIVGYPGEKKPIQMYLHTGPIKSINHRGIVHYEVDTTGGNSGSPGFLDLEKRESKTNDADTSNFPVCLVHCHASSKPVNGGEKFDDDLVEFLKSKVVTNP